MEAPPFVQQHSLRAFEDGGSIVRNGGRKLKPTAQFAHFFGEISGGRAEEFGGQAARSFRRAADLLQLHQQPLLLKLQLVPQHVGMSQIAGENRLATVLEPIAASLSDAVAAGAVPRVAASQL